MEIKNEFLVKRQKGFLIPNRDDVARPDKEELSRECLDFLGKNANSVAGNMADCVIRSGYAGICRVDGK